MWPFTKLRSITPSSANPSEDLPSGGDPLQTFLLSEYDHISKAHFNTVQTISEFFKTYLTLLTLPAAIAAIALKIFFPDSDGKTSTSQISPPQIANLASDVSSQAPPQLHYAELVLFTCWLVAIVGLLVMAYVINLRMEAVLYARTVNGIRRFFSDNSHFHFEYQNQFLVLPRVTTRPRYFEKEFFLPVIFTFAVLDSLYALVSSVWFVTYANLNQTIQWQLIGYSVILFLFHFGLYYSKAKRMDEGYLKSNNIGIDIDGVLNYHRTQFCTIYNKLYGGALDPDKIVKIPVHECAGLNVTEEQESNVFNDIDYWRKMPVVRDAASYIGKIRNLGYKIHIFTHRPWPDSSHVSRDAFKTTREKWGRIRIKKITKVWLAENRIHCDVLEVERGNTYTIDNRSLSHNRFTIAAKEQFKVFVEDDVRKARKLANSCDVVFLIEHPYNIYTESDPKDPVNLRRVKGWKDIYDYMRELY